MPHGYQFAPIFLIRMAGVPFDEVEKLATRQSCEAAREIIVRQERLAGARAEAKRNLPSFAAELSPAQMRAVHKALRFGALLPPEIRDLPWLAPCYEEADRLAAARLKLEQTLP